jgi:hypothetical protein
MGRMRSFVQVRMVLMVRMGQAPLLPANHLCNYMTCRKLMNVLIGIVGMYQL